MHFGGHAAPIITDRHRLIWMDNDIDPGAVASQSLVNGVVNKFEHHVVQACAVIGVTDIHARSLANRIQALEDLDAGGIITVLILVHQKTLTSAFRW